MLTAFYEFVGFMKSKRSFSSRSHSPGETFSIEVDSQADGLRLDQFLSCLLVSSSRSLISRSIGKGLVLVDGIKRKSSYRLKDRQVVKGTLSEPPEIEILPEKIDFPILYEDDYLLLLNKPPGLVVHPGSGNHRGTLVNGLVYYCREIADAGDGLRPGIVHRLDKDTSGIMVVAKNNNVHRMLVECFKKRLLEKEYLALVHGVPKEKNGRLVAAIGRHRVNRQKMAVRIRTGRYALTSWRVIEEFDNKFSLLKVNIETGRTHQIRVHLAHIGFPIVGDILYGGRGKTVKNCFRQLLHASRLAFDHPVSGRRLDVTAPLWPDFADFLALLDCCQT